MIIDSIVPRPVSVEIKEGLPPIRVFCLGTHTDPVTSQEVTDAMKCIEKNGDLPKDWPKLTRKYTVRRDPLPGTWIIQLGSSARPPTQVDVDDVKQQVLDTANEKQLTIVTHHNFHMTWVEQGKALIKIDVVNLAKEN